MVDTTEMIEQALTWANTKLGSPAYAGRCLAFVEDCFERGNAIEVNGYPSAQEAADGYGITVSDNPPPRGALVFFSCNGYVHDTHQNWGHVGISLGDGRVVHGWDTVRIDNHRAIEQLVPPPRWTAPVYTGWAPAERLLQGCKPRQWDP
jgi:cell wall-associated NlpC family hydrolase